MAPAATASDSLTALQVAEHSAVLLKNAGGVLPLAGSPGSVATIGVDAGTQAVTAGKGSAYVEAPFLVTPLRALRKAFGNRTRISFAPGDSTGLLAPIPAGDFVSGVPLPPETTTGRTEKQGNDPVIDHVRRPDSDRRGPYLPFSRAR